METQSTTTATVVDEQIVVPPNPPQAREFHIPKLHYSMIGKCSSRALVAVKAFLLQQHEGPFGRKVIHLIDGFLPLSVLSLYRKHLMGDI
ncbi:uncharacterized protein N7483_006263 [Penicillium malachiteum]|uniref:uncharacterized protein n=1 Tax=Penicillium malachiteum TaxID=1324776 RepID=UPI0025499DF6|nr:uncharacterized protein N7483_006263 [Penicillium malachiteum]KAJ5731755.1 hypothetical protein N7483_006263 [Penicillium malachiteum]